MKVPDDWGSGESSLPGCLLDVPLHGLFSMGASGEIERESLKSLLIRALILLNQGPILMTAFNLNYILRGPSPNTVTLGVRASTYDFSEGHKSVPQKAQACGGRTHGLGKAELGSVWELSSQRWIYYECVWRGLRAVNASHTLMVGLMCKYPVPE